MNRLRVAVIRGGPSAEAEVSRTSARGVVAALERQGHVAHSLELDAELPSALRALTLDVVFPVTHGTLGEDGCLQGLLEVLALPYVGSDVLASAWAANKPAAKQRLRSRGLPVLDDELLSASADAELILPQLFARLGAKLVVKPASGGSAIGVEMLERDAGLEAAVAAVARSRTVEDELLVEPFAEGLEVTCGVLETGTETHALPPTLIRPKVTGHYDFVSKYQAGGSEHVCPAPFEPALVQRIQALALEAHRALGCRDLSRTDFIVDPPNGKVVVLEVNTLPGMTPTSLFPEAAQVSGIAFEVLCDRLARRAATRERRRVAAAVPMP